jgi:sporulation-control protein
MMLRKFLSKIGVGSAKIDLVLNNNEYRLGEPISGEVRIEGGTVDQVINKIDVDFMVAVKVQDSEISKLIATIPVSDQFTVRSEERKVIPFTYQLPNDLLLSRRMISYFFKTRLDIAGGVDSFDNDFIKINPPQAFATIFLAMEKLGFRETANSGKFNGHSQEFEFFPTSLFLHKVQEVEFIGGIQADNIYLLLEVDVRNVGFHETELVREVMFTKSECNTVDDVAIKLQKTIEEMIDQPSSYDKRYSHYHTKGYKGSSKGSMIPGMIGGFAAGILGGMMVEELMENMLEDSGLDEMAEGAGDFDMGDFFGGDE